MSLYKARLKIGEYNLPIIDGNISYRNNFQYNVSLKLPKSAFDYVSLRHAIVELYNDEGDVLQYPFEFRMVEGDDVLNITGADFTQNLSYYYYKWQEVLDNMKSTTISTNANGEINITKYVYDAIVVPIFSSFTDKPLTYIDEYINTSEDTLKEYVVGLINDFIHNPSLAGLLNMMKRFGVTVLYDGKQYATIGAYTLWDRYINFSGFGDAYTMTVGNHTLDLTHMVDQVVVKNLAYLNTTEEEYTAKFPTDSDIQDIPNPKVRVEVLNVPVFDKQYLQRLATIIYLDEHMQTTTATYSLNAPDTLQYYYGVSIRIQQGLVYWLAKRFVEYNWWLDTGEQYLYPKREADMQIGCSVIASQPDMMLVGRTADLAIGSSMRAKVIEESAITVTRKATMEIGSVLYGYVFF